MRIFSTLTQFSLFLLRNALQSDLYYCSNASGACQGKRPGLQKPGTFVFVYRDASARAALPPAI